MPSAQTLGGRVRSFAHSSKPHIDIQFADAGSSPSVRTFSTYNQMRGTVTITPSHNTFFSNVEISLVGSTRTFIDRLSPSAAISARSEAFQLFLKMDQPIDESLYPRDRVLQAGKTYQFPFTFVVPDELPGSCKHKTSNRMLKDMHLKLPPSLGDSEVSVKGTAQLDDCTPEMVKISYGIRVRLQKQHDEQDKEIIVSEKMRKVRIVPALEEQPPIPVEDNDEYCLRREKNVRKGLLKSKVGTVVMEASQPTSLHLQPPNNENPDSEVSPTTMATVQLRFDPTVEDAEPPKLGQLVSKLRIGTFFASTPRMTLPSTRAQLHDTNQGLYVDVLLLSSRNMSATGWSRHDAYTSSASANLRRDSGMSLSGQTLCPEPTKAHKPELPFYTAQVLIPISLPKNRLLVPTFHSCLVSRIYNLELSLSLVQAATVTLKVPIQVSSGTASSPEDNQLDLIEGEGIEQELSGVGGDYFQPRRVSAPMYTELAGGPAIRQPVAPPPDYSQFAPRAGRASERAPALPAGQTLSMVR